MISWAHLAQPPEWLVAFWPIAFFERMPTSWCGQSSTGRRCGIVGWIAPLTAECPAQCFRGSDLAGRPAQNPS